MIKHFVNFLLFSLVVLPNLSICQEVEKIIVPIRSSYELKCVNKTNGPFVKVVWMSNAYTEFKDTVYSYDNKGRVYITEHFRNRITRYSGTSIQVKDARANDSGNWECNVIFQFTPKGEKPRQRVRVLAVYDVLVVSPPVITKLYPQISHIPKFGTASIYCDVKSSALFNITWEKLSSEISANVQFPEEWVNVKNGIYRKRSHMKFGKFDETNVGSYRCIARNIGGEAFKGAEVTMQVPPKIYARRTVIANVDSSVSLLCNATGFPTIQFSWRFIRKTRNITLHQREEYRRFHVLATEYYNSEAVSILFIRKIKKGDWGVYTCMANNKAGIDEKHIVLTGFSVPEAPTMLTADEISDTYVNLVWNLGHDGGRSTQSVIIQYKESNEVYWSSIEVSRPLITYEIMNLKPGIAYDFRVLSANRIGHSDYSKIYSMKTYKRGEHKPVTEKPSRTPKLILHMNVLTFTGVCGATILVITCIIVGCCLFYRYRKLKNALKNERKPCEQKELTKLEDNNDTHEMYLYS